MKRVWVHSFSLPRLACVVQVCLACLVPGTSLRACGVEAQRIVARVVVDALPNPLRTFLAARSDGLVERAIEPGTVWPGQARFRSRGQWHYVCLDAAADDGSQDARMRSALAFPTERSAARRVFRQRDTRRGGQLPWRLQELTGGLADAVETGDADQIVKMAGYVVHFATDASNPFCTSRNRRGAESGNRIFGRFEVGERLFAHQDVAHRIRWELVRRNAERYRESIDARSIRFELAVDASDIAFEFMIDSLECLEAVCRADSEILDEMGITEGDQFLERADEYYQLLDQRCGELEIDNLRRAARLAATLIVHAWTASGSPDPVGRPKLAHVVESAGTSATGASGTDDRETAGTMPDEPDIPAIAAGRIASKKSKVYHRMGCPHAKRIGPENAVRFPSRKEAVASGRRPCQLCLPADD